MDRSDWWRFELQVAAGSSEYPIATVQYGYLSGIPDEDPLTLVV